MTNGLLDVPLTLSGLSGFKPDFWRSLDRGDLSGRMGVNPDLLGVFVIKFLVSKNICEYKSIAFLYQQT